MRVVHEYGDIDKHIDLDVDLVFVRSGRRIDSISVDHI